MEREPIETKNYNNKNKNKNKQTNKTKQVLGSAEKLNWGTFAPESKTQLISIMHIT